MGCWHELTRAAGQRYDCAGLNGRSGSMMNDVQAHRCPICKGVDVSAFGERSGFPLGQCRACGHSFVQRLPTREEIDAVYERYSYDAQHLDALPAFLQPVIAEKVRSFEPYRRTGRLLDVGFGAGALLRAAKDQGWSPHGIEVSRLAVEQARRNGLGEIVQGDFLEAPFEPGFFDVIVMSELIEHLPAPEPFIRHARRLLAPGGLLYLTTPHGRGLSGRVLRETWSVCSPPEHLHLFSRRSMMRCLAGNGFGPIRVEARSVHPHELVQWAKRPFRSLRRTGGHAQDPSFGADDRVQGSYRVNAALVGSLWGRTLKRAANIVLDATSLGDGLVVHATASSSAATAHSTARTSP